MPTTPRKAAIKKAASVAVPPPGDEPTPEELEQSAKYGITVDALRELRAQLDGAIRAEVRAQEDAGTVPASAICEQHWPGGWPEGADHADCEHGTWKR